MRTYPFDRDGTITAFEIENTLISRRRIARLLATVPGVTDVKLGGEFGSANDIRVSFKYLGDDYEVEEPYGDNARYIVGPKDPVATRHSIEQIEAAFRGHRPALWRRFFNIIMLGWA